MSSNAIPPDPTKGMVHPAYRWRRTAKGEIESQLFDLDKGEPEGGWVDSPAKVDEPKRRGRPPKAVSTLDPPKPRLSAEEIMAREAEKMDEEAEDEDDGTVPPPPVWPGDEDDDK